MNKQEFYDAFKKGVTCAITCLIIFFSAIFCFYVGYKFGRERVLDSDSTDVISSSIQSKSLDTLSVVSPADTVTSEYTYYGASFPLRVGFYDYLGHDYNYGVDVIGDVNNSTLYKSMFIPFRFYFNRSFSTNEDGRYIGFDAYYSDTNISSSNNILNLSTFTDYGVWHFVSDYVAYPYNNYIFYVYYLEQNFNFNVVRIEISGGLGWGTDNIYVNTIYFYDNNGYSFKFEVVMSKNNEVVNPYYYLPTSRTYYLTGDISSDSYYQQGYQTGFETGLNSGKEQGYTNGYNSGYQDGELIGYNNGINTANIYSFSNLLTAVVEAPVNVFISLLDFNIMGYNLLSIVAGLLTLGVVVLVIKLCLGGK